MKAAYCVSIYTLGVRKYGNNVHKNGVSKIVYGFNCFPMEMMADVSKTNLYVNEWFYVHYTRNFFKYSFVI